MITLMLPNCLDTHPEEAQLVGDLVVRYGELEWMLCRVVGEVTGDLDATIKAMYRPIGERIRIEIADGLVSGRLRKTTFFTAYTETLAALHKCREIRNRYAHASWLSASEADFGFYNLRKLAESREPINLGSMTRTLVPLATIRHQSIFFAEVLHNLVHLFYVYEAAKAGREFEPAFQQLQLVPIGQRSDE